VSDFVKYTLYFSAGRNDCERLYLSRVTRKNHFLLPLPAPSRHYRRHVRADLSEQRQRCDRQLRRKTCYGLSRPG